MVGKNVSWTAHQSPGPGVDRCLYGSPGDIDSVFDSDILHPWDAMAGISVIVEEGIRIWCIPFEIIPESRENRAQGVTTITTDLAPVTYPSSAHPVHTGTRYKKLMN